MNHTDCNCAECRLTEQVALLRWQGCSVFEEGVSLGCRYVTMISPRPKMNNLAHLLFTILTMGLWLPVWIVLLIVYGMKDQKFTLVANQYNQIRCYKGGVQR